MEAKVEPINPYSHLAADKLADEVITRLEGTDWRYVQGYTRNHSRFQGVIAKHDVAPPTQEMRMNQEFPDEYYEVTSSDYESFEIGVKDTLNRLKL